MHSLAVFCGSVLSFFHLCALLSFAAASSVVSCAVPGAVETSNRSIDEKTGDEKTIGDWTHHGLPPNDLKEIKTHANRLHDDWDERIKQITQEALTADEDEKSRIQDELTILRKARALPQSIISVANSDSRSLPPTKLFERFFEDDTARQIQAGSDRLQGIDLYRKLAGLFCHFLFLTKQAAQQKKLRVPYGCTKDVPEWVSTLKQKLSDLGQFECVDKSPWVHP